MGKWKKRICVVLCVIVTFSGSQVQYAAATESSELTNDSIKEKQSQISEAQKAKQALQSGVTDVKKILQSLESSKKNLASYVQQLDSSLDGIQKKLDDLNAMIDEKSKEITETKAQLVKAEAVEKEQYESMKKRIKFMYERGDAMYVEMILTSRSFGEFLNKNGYVQKLAEYDQRMLQNYKETKEAIDQYKKELEEEQEILGEAKTAAKQEEASMQVLISAKEQEIGVYEADISNKSNLVKEYEAEIAAQTAAISALEKAVAEEKKRLEEANQAVRKYDGGIFTFPAPSYKRVSDDYGYRIHPTLGVKQFHNGVDLAAPNGSPILAGYDGTVVAATYSSTMGNYVMLDHGDGLYTIYMHASALSVSKGQEVSKGQQIGSVGSTGRSTGPHLHFSVRLNGAYVSPWNYISR
ncbi:MAG: peptidoglycan DD-metalloendopeptidase family protein [Lachnospiraceae bacterium]|nr:peptidoglycan DD-metalloendopeptidase family protein [Lachnospiraceae bacterium]